MPYFSGKFPTDWKIARVAPQFTRAEREMTVPPRKIYLYLPGSNYRPISVLRVLFRAFEKVVYNQPYDYLQSNRLIYKHQSGF